MLLSYERGIAEHPYADVWDPKATTIEPLDESLDDRGGAIVGISVRSGTLLVLESDGEGTTCLHRRSLTDPQLAPRWERCEIDTGRARIQLSPDGQSFALVHERRDDAEQMGVPEPDEIRVGDAWTGKYTAAKRIDADYVTGVLWEDDNTLVIRHAPTTDSDTWAADEATRCSSALGDCERVPGPVDATIGAVASDRGTGLPIRR